jgi:hypothetical protein
VLPVGTSSRDEDVDVALELVGETRVFLDLRTHRRVAQVPLRCGSVHLLDAVAQFLCS